MRDSLLKNEKTVLAERGLHRKEIICSSGCKLVPFRGDPLTEGTRTGKQRVVSLVKMSVNPSSVSISLNEILKRFFFYLLSSTTG